jgi:lipoprotein-releasing system permease protein
MLMSFELKLALKYFRTRRKSLARFTTLVAIVGIAAGVASLILAQSLSNGFANEMQEKILANTSHISIFSNDGTEIFNWQAIKKELETSEDIAEVSATTFQNSIIIGKEAKSYSVLRVQDSRFKVQGSRLKSQNLKVSIGKELAEKTGLKKGDEAELITIDKNETPKNSKVYIAEIFQTGLYEYDATWIYISTEDFVKLTDKPRFTPTILSVSVKDIYEADRIAEEIRGKLGDNFKVLDWQEANQPLFAALGLERKVALAIISLIIFIASLNITTTLALLVNERKLDIAVLRTCGAKTRNLLTVFLSEGLFLGFIGILFGVIFGLLGCFAGNYFKIVSLPSEVYSLSYISFQPGLIDVFLIIFITFVLCLAATIYPALKASRIKPLENLRRQ